MILWPILWFFGLIAILFIFTVAVRAAGRFRLYRVLPAKPRFAYAVKESKL